MFEMSVSLFDWEFPLLQDLLLDKLDREDTLVMVVDLMVDETESCVLSRFESCLERRFENERAVFLRMGKISPFTWKALARPSVLRAR